jgi:hypothetical protein
MANVQRWQTPIYRQPHWAGIQNSGRMVHAMAENKSPAPVKITMYLGSMDHSPSEQLGELDQWHTTVVVLSEGGEHWGLAEDLARRLNCNDGQLRKWSRNPSYRKNGTFETSLIEAIRNRPVYVRAISAKGHTIRACLPHFTQELRLQGLVTEFFKNERTYLRFGPFTRVTIEGVENSDLITRSEPHKIEIVEHQALPLLFISHFVLRTHQALMPIIRKDRPELEWIDWQLMPNKFPGDHKGPMGSLFHAIMSGATNARLVAGNVRIATFDKAKDDLGSALADNIAGLFTEKLNGDHPTRAFADSGDALEWEVWQSDVANPSAGRSVGHLT